MPRTGTPSPSSEDLQSIVSRQSGRCAGIAHHLTQGCQNEISETLGHVQHIIPRALQGDDHASNLEIMCNDCHGMSNRTIRFPNYLISEGDRWAKEHNVRSFTHLVRMAVTDYMLSETPPLDRRDNLQMMNELQGIKEDKLPELHKQVRGVRDSIYWMSDHGERPHQTIGDELPYLDQILEALESMIDSSDFDGRADTRQYRTPNTR